MSDAGLLERTAPLYDRVRRVVPAMEWPFFANDVEAILCLKRERRAVILAHNYQTPEIFHCVSDIVGDSLALARRAIDVEADVIVLAGVHFMAETAKLLNPGRIVLIPDANAGCSLAESITAADVRALRLAHPGVTVLAHPECPPAVVAEADFSGSTAMMEDYLQSHAPLQIALITECSMSDNLAVRHPEVDFIRPCNLCPHMKRITLAGIRHALETMTTEVVIDPAVAGRARLAVERMLAV